MGRLIDAEALSCAILKRVGELMDENHPQTAGALEGATHFILEAPTVDAVEVVRCGECAYSKDSSAVSQAYRCDYSLSPCRGRTTYADFGCLYGHRKAGAK